MRLVGRRSMWVRFRTWPWWAQALLWVLLWPVPLVFLAAVKPHEERRKWWAIAIAGCAVWVGLATIGSHSDTKSKQAGSQSSSGTTTTAQPEALSSSADPDEVADPDAANATAPSAAGSFAPSSDRACR